MLHLFLLPTALSINAQVNREIGINLSEIHDYSSEYVFVDAFKQSRKWIAHEYGSGAPWSSGVDIPLGANGYPLEIPYDNGIDPPQAIRTLMFFGDLEGQYPSGNYRLIASGTGQIRLTGAANGTYTCPVDTIVNVQSNLGGIIFEIDTSLVTDPVKDIHFIMPGFHNSYSQEPFHPELLSFIDDFQVIRFMNWMKTNNSPVVNWLDRTTSDYYSQTLDQGLAYEYIIKLCNLKQKDAWICVPHRANNNYIQELAQLFSDSLDENLTLYVEYSNEVWNSGFSQRAYADSMGNALGYTGNSWEQGWKYYAKRAADVMTIFDAVFNDSTRLKKVISSQAANSWLGNYHVERFNESTYNPSQVKADVLAIAPYFAGAVANNIGAAGIANTITVNEILDSMELALPTAFARMDDYKAVADEHNLELVAYEGGQHLVANYLYNSDTAFVSKLIDANKHSRMENLYCQYFEHWYDSTQASMFAHYSSHTIYSRYGSFGVKEFYGDTLSPKYLGLKNCVFAYNSDSTLHISTISDKNNILIYPTPSYDGIIYVNHDFIDPQITLFDNLGRIIPFTVNKTNLKQLSINVRDFSGYAILVIEDKGKYYSKRTIFLK